jgi:hypothetical protein
VTAAESRVALLLTLMRQLQELMRTENALLRELRAAGPLPQNIRNFSVC